MYSCRRELSKCKIVSRGDQRKATNFSSFTKVCFMVLSWDSYLENIMANLFEGFLRRRVIYTTADLIRAEYVVPLILSPLDRILCLYSTSSTEVYYQRNTNQKSVNLQTYMVQSGFEQFASKLRYHCPLKVPLQLWGVHTVVSSPHQSLILIHILCCSRHMTLYRSSANIKSFQKSNLQSENETLRNSYLYHYNSLRLTGFYSADVLQSTDSCHVAENRVGYFDTFIADHQFLISFYIRKAADCSSLLIYNTSFLCLRKKCASYQLCKRYNFYFFISFLSFITRAAHSSFLLNS